MSNAFAEALREAVRGRLPHQSFLRRDRGGALFATDAPRRMPETDWRAAFEALGFICREENGLMRLTPGAAWMEALTARFPEPPDFLCASLKRFDGLPPEDASIELFALGLRVLDGAPDGGFDRRLRQRAAICLRSHTSGFESNAGGGLYACALIDHMIEEERRI